VKPSAPTPQAYRETSLSDSIERLYSKLSATQMSSRNGRPDTWHIHDAGVRVGLVMERSGIANAASKADACFSIVR
jgi:hypothetical protein